MQQEKNKNIWMLTGISIFVLIVVNRWVHSIVSGGQWVFSGDDLGNVTYYLNHTAGEYIFSLGANKFRPVTGLATYLIFMITENNWNAVNEILMIVNGINAVLIFCFIYRVQKEKETIKKVFMALLGAIMFLISHFSFYVNTELTGLLESMGYGLALGILFLLILYIETGKNIYFYVATILYGLILYTHERYFVLFFLFVAAVIINKRIFKKSFKILVLPGVLVVSFWILRFILFGERMLDGTGGTDINETFHLAETIKFCFSQVGYILGFQCGPQYLNGIEAGQVAWYVNLALIIRIIFIFCIAVLFIRLLFIHTAFRQQHLGNLVLFLCFLALCIGSSSITIRVGMQWIYVSYAAFLVMLFWMMDSLQGYYGDKYRSGRILYFLIFFILTFFTEQYYRSYSDNIANCEERTMVRALYQATVGTYGSSLENSDVMIVSQRPFFGTSTKESWQTIFAPYMDSSGLTVSYAKSYHAAQKSKTNATIVLLEDRKNKYYADISELFRVHIDTAYGYYEDAWFEPDCLIEIEECPYSKAILGFYYPDEIENVLHGTILRNGEIYKEFSSDENWTEIEVELEKNRSNQIQILSDYVCIKNSDRNGADLCGTLSIRYE